mgnify:FL=1
MTDAPKTVGLVHNGFGGWRLWTADDADDPTVVPVPYILAAEHERLMAGRDAEITRLRNDCRILLAQIAWLEECTGEGLEGEDAALVAEIAATVGDDNG